MDSNLVMLVDAKLARNNTVGRSLNLNWASLFTVSWNQKPRTDV